MNEAENLHVKHETHAPHLPPIIVDLGKVRGKRIKQLREGKGPLIQSVDEALQSVREQLKHELAGKELLPVVLVYRKKRKKAARTILNPFGLQ